jgi:winged helix DNA-binding protein
LRFVLKNKPPVVAEVSWQQVHAFRLAGHHLDRRAPKQDFTRVVGDIGGVQAQVMSAAELQVGVRVDCKVADVRTALWKDRSLVKTWLMRGTLHLVPAADLPLYTAAMSTRWIRTLGAWLKFVQLTEPEFVSILNSIGETVDGNPMTREELISKVAHGSSAHVREVLKSGWGGMLKPVARRGRLCFGPNRGQSVTFVRPQLWLDSWTELDPDAALVEVARRYLRAYGPATKVDFARWWGAWPGVGTAAWAGLAGELVNVSVEGLRADILAKDLGRLESASGGSSVRLLPAFDPYLMGHSGRDHLFEPAYRARVSRTAGWISPVVLVGGRVVATWSHSVAKGVLHIAVEPFRRLPPKLRPEIRLRAGELAATMGLAKVEVTVV